MQARDVTRAIQIADQPDTGDLDVLAQSGFRGVVNLRKHGEPEQPLDPGQEAHEVRTRGMAYLHHPMGGEPIPAALVLDVARFVAQHSEGNGRVLVHCRKGGRAAAIVLLALAQAEGWKPAEALERGKSLGLSVEGGLKALVEDYLQRESGSAV